MYVNPNFKTNKEFKTALEEGRLVEVFQPNNMFNTPTPCDGDFTIEGPHYPQPHKWYATVTMKDGKIVKLDGKVIKRVHPKPTYNSFISLFSIGAVLEDKKQRRNK